MGASLLSDCRDCQPPEGSDAGAAVCWPGVLSAVASDPAPVEVGLTVGDQVDVTFSQATTRPSNILSLITVTPSIGTVSSHYCNCIELCGGYLDRWCRCGYAAAISRLVYMPLSLGTRPLALLSIRKCSDDSNLALFTMNLVLLL